jgi:hypothetical protein
MVALMLTYQPMFMGGIDDVKSAKKSAVGALATFLFTFILSVVYLVQDSLRGGADRGGIPSTRRRGGVDYDGVPTNMGGGIISEYSSNLDLPPSVEQAHFT